MKEFENFFLGRNILILGFGLEGKSSYKAIRNYLPSLPIAIADKKEGLPEIFSSEFNYDPNVKLFYGENYLNNIKDYGLIIKSPGISFRVFEAGLPNSIITSQTEIFIKLFKEQIVGITGTKGKSTTTSLLMHILKKADKDAVLAGNIGVPPFDFLKEIGKNTIIAFEMSSHQLENINVSPHIAILLNIYQEHLDHYENYNSYKESKFNIAKWQTKDDYFIVNFNNRAIRSMPAMYSGNGNKIFLDYNEGESFRTYCTNQDIHFVHEKEHVFYEICNRRKILGGHNLINIQAALAAATLLGVEPGIIQDAVSDFQGLPHRLEQIIMPNGTMFINDSISTIPEATIAALKTFPKTNTLILGGYDRGVFYDELVEFIMQCNVENLILLGDSGNRIHNIIKQNFPVNDKKCYTPSNFDMAVELAKELTKEGGTCLLSPAAASYDSFKNFKERGDRFKALVNKTYQ